MGDACPTDDTLGALVEHALDEAEAARVSSHIDTCEACRAAVIAAVRGESKTPPKLPKTPIPIIADAVEPPLLVGARMGRYEIKSLLGVGGMGQVYSAYDAELDRAIALKVLRPELARNAAIAERLQSESRLMAKIAHPSVITVYDVGREGDALFIAMELVRGETLAAYVARVKPSWRDVVAIFERAGQGLAAAHDAGIVHRDFKPENVLVENDGARVIVTDFGIATAVFSEGAGMAIGTPAYMAPEQLAGGAIDHRVDVFAFTVSLWEALFGERPFRGKTLDELRVAMNGKPRLPRTNVPPRLVRALSRGLAVKPAERWPDMHAFVRELASVRSTRKKTIALAAAGGIAVVSAGIAIALMVRGNDELACDTLDVDSSNLAIDDEAKQRLAYAVRAWRETTSDTCNARTTAIATCLDARKLEIESVIDDARRIGADASSLVRVIVDPMRCRNATPGLAFARVPDDPILRRDVSSLRIRAFAVERARDRQDFAAALELAKKLVEDAKLAWPPVLAEMLYLHGTVEAQSGHPDAALAALQEAAALAERTHHAYIAANSWIQLIQSAAFDSGDPSRALEYAKYADAALDGLGRPADLEVLFLYFKGTAMLEADQASKDAEAILRRAVDLAARSAPQYLARATLGLGYAYEEQGRYKDAADTYRNAIALLERGGPQTSAHTFRERLAINLSLLGTADEAERVARQAVAMADRDLDPANIDRAIVRTTLAQVLVNVGKREEALVEVRKGTKLMASLVGERNARFGEMLSLEGSILVEMQHFDEAAATLGRACEIIAFGVGENTTQYAECLLSQSIAFDGAGKAKQALENVDRGIGILMAVDGEIHPRVASALVQRGALRSAFGRYEEGIADLEKAVSVFEQLQLEPGHLAGAKWALGKTLRDRTRGKRLVEEAVALFAKGSTAWAETKADAEAWLRADGGRLAPK